MVVVVVVLLWLRLGEIFEFEETEVKLFRE